MNAWQSIAEEAPVLMSPIGQPNHQRGEQREREEVDDVQPGDELDEDEGGTEIDDLPLGVPDESRHEEGDDERPGFLRDDPTHG